MVGNNMLVNDSVLCSAVLVMCAGAGGNPVLRGSTGDSCRLWLQAPVKPRDSLSAQLAAQVEAAREQVQHYAQAADAAALTAHCALTEAAQQVCWSASLSWEC